MSEWQDIATAPLDGTPVKAGYVSEMWFGCDPLYPLTSRFIDGKWKCDMGDRWAEYVPQPNRWSPIQPLKGE